MNDPDIQPAPGGVGAYVRGVDIAHDMNDNLVGALTEALGQHGVLFFRDQTISEAEHIAFAGRFGDINRNRFFARHQDWPEIALVEKEAHQKDNIGGDWHTDHSYDAAPALGSVLVARQTPTNGGDTLFTNMYAAWETLSEGLKRSLETMCAEHSSRRAFGPRAAEYTGETDTAGRLGNPELAVQDSVHPVVIRHPISGRKALYVNPGFTIRFHDWSEAESKPLLQYLYRHAQRPEFTYRFRWRDGSVAFWDNRCTWHYALNDYPDQYRLMHRITIDGCALTA